MVVVNKLWRYDVQDVSLENRFHCINQCTKLGDKYKWTSICRSVPSTVHDLIFMVYMTSSKSSYNMGIVFFENSELGKQKLTDKTGGYQEEMFPPVMDYIPDT